MASAIWTSEAWKALAAHTEELQTSGFRVSEAMDAGRVGAMTRSLEEGGLGLVADFSKAVIDGPGLELLVALGEAAGVDEKKKAMFGGDHINATEDRAVGHVALRMPEATSVLFQSEEEDAKELQGGGEGGGEGGTTTTSSFTFAEEGVDEVRGVLLRMKKVAEDVRSGAWVGATGKRITKVVNIGIGGSYLGPEMVVTALAPYATQEIEFAFVANIDPSALAGALEGADRESTLFIICSKTFTTAETMKNAHAARSWLVEGEAGLGEAAVGNHFVAASANVDRAVEFGIAENNVFGFWDWVGGRYSVWSAIGLSGMMALGPQAWGEFLSGAHAMDEHFYSSPVGESIPSLAGLLSVYHTSFCGFQAQAIVPYDENLARFTPYLQQLICESNGKGVTLDGTPIPGFTGPAMSGPVVWGATGTNGQHSFFQLIHQGQVVPLDLFGALESHAPSSMGSQHEMLIANMIAQSEALMVGKEHEDPARTFSGNRPSTVYMYSKLTPATLGALIAMYEHATFTLAALLDINAFDQFGVELGKVLASTIVDEIEAGQVGSHDASTTALLSRFIQARRQ